jgi:hypothetical protein
VAAAAVSSSDTGKDGNASIRQERRIENFKVSKQSIGDLAGKRGGGGIRVKKQPPEGGCFSIPANAP